MKNVKLGACSIVIAASIFSAISCSKDSDTSPSTSPRDERPVDNGSPHLTSVVSSGMISVSSEGYKDDYPDICGISGGKILCIANNNGEWGIMNVPSLLNPTYVAVGGSHYACAIDGKRVICWGGDHTNSLLQSLLDKSINEPVIVAIPQGGEPHYPGVEGIPPKGCVIEKDSTLKCWFLDPQTKDFSLKETPSLSGVKQVSISQSMACAIKNHEARCWTYVQRMVPDQVGYQWVIKEIAVPALTAPREINVGANTACAIDGDVIQCWGKFANQPPTVKNPRSLSMGKYRGCVLDDEGVKCWADSPNAAYFSAQGKDFDSVNWAATGPFENFCGVKQGKFICVIEKYPGKFEYSQKYPY